MSYLALARKWRPRDFSQVVGQEHVVKALSHALDTQRVHHAFLLTGTRGIGKTTLARILAKCLNCETKGVSSTPCNHCRHCKAVDEGRFIDLVEVDAASRTRVDDTRELLDNVQYAPTTGQYKIYLIDEVHMLSGHSFNALLKTLEEPPLHVKFVLATTDPQKLPVTVLSRCLQFYLKVLTIEQICTQLKTILGLEGIEFDEAAIRLLARSAKGSIRDSLSLLDQAIAFGGGKVEESKVRAMLGLVDDQFIFQILTALADNDVNQLLQTCNKMAEKSVDFVNAIDELISKVHQISLLHFAPELDVETITDKEQLLGFAQRLDKETLQLLYQIALLGKRDLYLAPDLRTGMEMTLLRMIAFKPVLASKSVSAMPVKNKPLIQPSKPPAKIEKATIQKVDELCGDETDEQVNSSSPLIKDWHSFTQTLPLTGFAREVVMNSLLANMSGENIELHVAPSCSHLINDKRKDLIQAAFVQLLAMPVSLKLTLQDLDEKTPKQLDKDKHDALQQEAERAIKNDPNVKGLIDDLDASIIPGSVRAN